MQVRVRYRPELVACGAGPTASDVVPRVSSNGPCTRPLPAGVPKQAALVGGTEGLNLEGEFG